MTTALPAPIARLIEATNNGDIESFLGGFTDNGVVDDWGREFTGSAEIGSWSEAEFIGKQVTLSVLDFESAGSETVLTAQVGGNGFNGPSTFTFVVDGNALSRMNIRA
ncbi:nuclear transport factor 2 family protein [Nocardia sp. NPDC058633]|uniref:nuclear transport factor 2 family protein n=1 Tax=Nocardia sp. NPDC058633 TaxID=3346568 RepID=UPI00366031BA